MLVQLYMWHTIYVQIQISDYSYYHKSHTFRKNWFTFCVNDNIIYSEEEDGDSFEEETCVNLCELHY